MLWPADEHPSGRPQAPEEIAPNRRSSGSPKRFHNITESGALKHSNAALGLAAEEVSMAAAERKAPQSESIDRSAPRKLPQIVQLVHDKNYYILPQTPFLFLASPECDLSGGQIRLFMFLVTNSWTYGRLHVGRRRKSKFGKEYWESLRQADIAEALGVDDTRLNHDLAVLEEYSLAYTDDRGWIYPWPFPIPPGSEAKVGESANLSEASPYFSMAVSLKSAYEAKKRAVQEAHIAPLRERYHQGLQEIKTAAKKHPEAPPDALTGLGDFANFFELSPITVLGESANFSLPEPPTPIDKERAPVRAAVLNRKEQEISNTSPVPSSSVVLACLNGLHADDDAAKLLIRKIQEHAPDATEAEIVHFIATKRGLAEGKRNPVGFLMTAVPKCFEGEAFRQYRAAATPKAINPYNPKCPLCSDFGWLGDTGADLVRENACTCAAGREFLAKL